MSRSAFLAFDEVCKRAGGRRRYNARRQTLATHRRQIIASRLAEMGTAYGIQAELARELGVSRATVCRDLKAMNTASADHRFRALLNCPMCGAARFTVSEAE